MFWPNSRISPSVTVLEPGDHPQKRGLAAARGAEKGEEGIVGNIEGNAGERRRHAIALHGLRTLIATCIWPISPGKPEHPP